MRDINFINKDLKLGDFSGVVIDNNDPTFSGRCRIKVFGLMDDVDEAFIPWFTPHLSLSYAPTGSASISIPKLGAVVRVVFNNGDVLSGEYTSMHTVDKYLREDIKDDYIDSHVLLHDESQDLKIMFKKGSGLIVHHKNSQIIISPDSMITISHSNNDSIIQLEGDKISIVSKSQINITSSGVVDVVSSEVNVIGKNSTNIGAGDVIPALRSDTIMALLSTMAKTIDAKFPAAPGTMETMFESVRPKCVSKNVNLAK